MPRIRVLSVLIATLACLLAPRASALGAAEHEAVGFKADHVYDVYTQGENVNVFTAR